ncbi:hypothetical protein BC361_24910 [Ensifer sp. LC54]|nr:hypothetical protein BC363_28085 [Ensifer sp. LC384]OCP22366.1 hypothetical protein BC361_24910 [Ensifer sp. LC54]
MNFKRSRLMARRLADHHLLHELAHNVDEGLFRFGVGVFAHVIEGGVEDQLDGFRTDLRLQLPDLLPEIFLRRRLVQPGLEAGATLLKRVEHIVEGGKARAALGRAIADLLDDLALFLFGSLQLPGNALALVGFLLHRGCEVLARLTGDIIEDAHAEERGGEAGQNAVLQVLAQDGLLVGAAGAVEAIDWQLVLVVRAAVAFLGHDGVGTAALGAFQHAAQQVARAVCPVQPIGLRPRKVLQCRQLPFLHARPEFIADDAHVGDFRYDPIAFVVETGRAAFGLRILAVVLLVPDDPADIEFVVEDAALALAVATDGVIAPVLLLGRRNAARIEALRDRRRTDAVGILLEDPAYDLGLSGVDLAQAPDTVAVGVALLAEAVAVGEAGGRLALARRRLHAFPRAEADLPDKFVTEHGAKRHLHVRNRGAGMDRPEIDIAIAQFLEDLMAVLDVARQAIDSHAEHHVDALLLHAGEKLLDAWAQHEGRSADRRVGIGLDQLPALLLDKGLAEFDLRFDRYLVLAVGGVAGIKQNGLGHLRNSISNNLFGEHWPALPASLMRICSRGRSYSATSRAARCWRCFTRCQRSWATI